MGTVLITGCSSGFGLEAALAFARRGDTTYATMRNLDKSGPLLERAESEGVAVELAAMDVTDEKSVDSAVSEILSRHGSIDVLVNNAGIAGSGPVETVSLDVARSVFETNLWGAVNSMRAVLPGMRAAGSGVIVNVTSVAARLPGVPYMTWYGASKHALGNVSEGLSSELDGTGVRVVCIEPGFFRTSIGANSVAELSDAGDGYEKDWAWVGTYYANGVRDGADPVIVADAVVRAAYDDATPLHVLVPADMRPIVDASVSVTHEEWKPMLFASFEASAGPRPARPNTSRT